jgi:HPt (histidine-containing phosphotransfer) domain-containing protein
MELKISGINTELGLSYYDGDLEIYLPLLRSYILNTPASLDKIRTVTFETLKDYAIIIHGLKGTSASIGAEMTREAALNLEALARAGDLNGILANNETFINDTEKIVAGIKEWVDDYDAKNKKPLLKAPSPIALEKLRQSCKNFSMRGIDSTMSELENADYEQDAGLIAWLREKINNSELSEIAERISNYQKELKA